MTMSMTHGLFISLTLVFTLLFPSSFCLRNLPLSAPQGSGQMEDKIRLGSTPPSCHNRCNECYPCLPVQVPTLPTGARTGTDRDRAGARTRPMLVDQTAVNQYSNYKPLGWKCRCGDRLFNP